MVMYDLWFVDSPGSSVPGHRSLDVVDRLDLSHSCLRIRKAQADACASHCSRLKSHPMTFMIYRNIAHRTSKIVILRSAREMYDSRCAIFDVWYVCGHYLCFFFFVVWIVFTKIETSSFASIRALSRIGSFWNRSDLFKIRKALYVSRSSFSTIWFLWIKSLRDSAPLTSP